MKTLLERILADDLPVGTILHHTRLRNADGTPLRARVNGKIRKWKTRPGSFEIPMKHGLRECFRVDQHNVHHWTLP